MKTTKITLTSMTLGLGALLAMSPLRADSAQSACCYIPPLPNTLTSYIEAWPLPVATAEAYLHVTVQSSSFTFPPAPTPASYYLGWCIDYETLLLLNGPYSAPPSIGNVSGAVGTLYSSCDPALNSYLAALGTPPNPNPPPATLHYNLQVDAAHWNAINYLLNHKTPSSSYMDVQYALWSFIGYQPPLDANNQPVGDFGFLYPPVDQANVLALVTAATTQAMTGWPTPIWTPKCGDALAQVLVLDHTDKQPSQPIQVLIIEVPCTCPSANCVVINAVQGVPITPVTMVGSGGCGGPYTFSATGLPNALTMSPGGTISGTPTVSGPFSYTVTVTDSCGNKGTVNCSVTVNPPPSADCITINGVQGVPITPVTMVGKGGCGSPYTFSATGLPNGLTMSPGGTISGTPTVSGPFSYTVTVTDSCGNKGTVNCSVMVTVQPAAIGDFVWLDSNTNGVQDAGEPGVPGVVVTLTDCKGNPVTDINGLAVGPTTTGTNGFYQFTNLKPGQYQVSVTLPPEYNFTQPFLGGNTNKDSNISPTLGTSDCRTLAAGQYDNTVDAGIFKVVKPPTWNLGHGDTATIGFWHNKNGQALILAMNGGGTSTQLGNWLASTFPCLYGSLAGKPNSVVAAQYMTYFQVTGQKTYAQVMAGALACYATSSTLAGSNVAAKCGFNVSSAGTGAKTYNVGAYGSAIGLVNNTIYPVLDILKAANAKCPFGTSGTVFDALNVIFSGINESGDIQ